MNFPTCYCTLRMFLKPEQHNIQTSCADDSVRVQEEQDRRSTVLHTKIVCHTETDGFVQVNQFTVGKRPFHHVAGAIGRAIVYNHDFYVIEDVLSFQRSETTLQPTPHVYTDDYDGKLWHGIRWHDHSRMDNHGLSRALQFPTAFHHYEVHRSGAEILTVPLRSMAKDIDPDGNKPLYIALQSNCSVRKIGWLTSTAESPGSQCDIDLRKVGERGERSETG